MKLLGLLGLTLGCALAACGGSDDAGGGDQGGTAGNSEGGAAGSAQAGAPSAGRSGGGTAGTAGLAGGGSSGKTGAAGGPAAGSAGQAAGGQAGKGGAGPAGNAGAPSAGTSGAAGKGGSAAGGSAAGGSGGSVAAGSGGAPGGSSGSAGTGGDGGSAAGGAGGDAGGAAGSGDAGAGAGGVGGAGASGAGAGGKGGAGGAGAGGSGPPPCLVSICLNGAYFGDPLSGGNGYFDDVCKAIPGILPQCGSDGTCYSSFEWLQLSKAEDALFSALDTNGDGVVDTSDKDCQVRVAGYSWGGVNSQKLADSLLADSRYTNPRKKIHRMLVIDPYQPTQSTVDVPPNVEAFWEFRHSVAPASDCSGSAPLGPYKGLPPRCHTGAFCFDYDYSLSGSVVFPGYSGVKYQGKQIDHCTMADVGGLPLLSLFADKSFSPAPKSVPVEIY